MNNIKKAIRQINSEISDDDDKVLTFLSDVSLSTQRTLIANMAIMYGLAHEKTIIVDVDFSSNAFLKSFKINSKVGLSDYLDNKISSLERAIHVVGKQNISILGSGSLSSADTNFLIGDNKFEILIRDLLKIYDRVLINTPKFDEIDSLKKLIHVSSNVVLVVDSEQTNKREFYRMMKQLVKIDSKVLGYVNVKKG